MTVFPLQDIGFESRIDPGSIPVLTHSFKEALTGTINISGGNFGVLNGDGLFDQLLDKYVWLNAEVVIKRGYDDQDYDDYVALATVNIVEYNFDRNIVKYSVRNKLNQLFEEIPKDTFLATDSNAFASITYGSTYPDNLLGKPKPLAWGIFDVNRAPVLSMIREDKAFVDFTANYSTTSKTSTNMSATEPAYNPDVSFTSTAGKTEVDANGNTVRFQATIAGQEGYFQVANNFWQGYYVQVPGTGELSKISSYNYEPTADIATFYLDVSNEDELIVESDNFTFKLYCPVYHFFVADHLVKSITAVYVNQNDQNGSRSWLHLSDDETTAEGDWTRIVVPINNYSTSTKTKCAFLSKDLNAAASAGVVVMENHSDIVRDILTGGILSNPFLTADLDTDSFDTSKTDRPYPLAIYLDEPIKAIDVLKKIRQSVIAKLIVTPTGLIQYVAWRPSNPLDSNIKELSSAEIIDRINFESLLRSIYYGFVLKYAQDGETDIYQEERYVYKPTKYIFNTTQMETITTYLINPSHARRTAERYTYFNRNKRLGFKLSIPHTMLNSGTIEETLQTVGEYFRLTGERAPGERTLLGEYGQYRKIYEILRVQHGSRAINLEGNDVRGLIVDAGFWSNASGDPPTGFWSNSDGEIVPGDDTTKNKSLWS